MATETNRSLIPFTGEHFAAFCQKMVGQPYWYGCVMYKCTDSVLARKTKQYPAHYGSSRTPRYKKDIAANKVAADCVGGCKGYAWTNGGEGVLESIGTNNTFANKYGANGCPDKSANGMFSWAKSKGMDWGAISTLPEIIGLALHKDGHIGYYIGGGYAVEWKGFNYGCVKTKIAGRGWTHWYKLPFINYGEVSETLPPTSQDVALGSRLLKKGIAGNDVKALQELLLKLGYALPKYGADGDYGAETEAAVMAFQKAAELETDGKYGDQTHAALMAAASDQDGEAADDSTPVTPAPERPTPEVPVEMPGDSAKHVTIVCDGGGNVNVRVGNGTEYNRISTVASGTRFEYVATASNGWHAVVIGGRVGWVSGKYSKVE